MRKNMGSFDQIIRILVAIAICVLYYTNVITGTLAIVLGVVAVVFFITSVVGNCPLYTILGINSCKVSRR